MKTKRILQSLFAVIMAAMMLLLASCGAAEDVSADGDNRLTRAKEEETVADTKAATEEKTEETTTKAAETTAAVTTSADVKKIPEKPIYYDEYIIDAVTGEVFLATDFTEPETNGYTIFRDDSNHCGVKDKNGNIVIDAMYDSLEGNTDNTYFYFKLNDAYGVLNEKGEIIIKGLDHNTDLLFYPENIVAYTSTFSLYSLPGGEFIGEYEQIRDFDDKTFLVTSSYGNDNPYAKIIDSKGNQIADILSDSQISADQFSSILSYSTYGDIINTEIPLREIILISNNGDWSCGLFNKKGEKIEGWIQVPQNGYVVSYLYSNIVTNSLRSDDNAWLVNVYDYSGKKLGSFEKEYSINGKVFKEEDSNVYLRADGSKIGEFSDYSQSPFEYYTNRNNWSNAVIVTDIDGMFKGVIIGDELKYPCEYTNIDFVDGNNSFERGQLLRLQKGSETIYITAETGAVVDLPQ
jgi:hypothetical protein